MKFPTVEEMAQNVAENALDEWEYKGKTLREWVEIILATDINVATKLSTNLASLGTGCSEFPNNSDAISRQSVIDVLDETKRIARQNIDGAVLITFERVLDSLVNIANALPTIQPERKECEERDQGKCPWYAG